VSLGSSVIIPSVDYDQCHACAKCEAAKHCPRRALVRFDRDEPPYVEVTLCGGCGDCVQHCPYEAIKPPDR
jgi:MinD superfamily P-loop ATPase